MAQGQNKSSARQLVLVPSAKEGLEVVEKSEADREEWK